MWPSQNIWTSKEPKGVCSVLKVFFYLLKVIFEKTNLDEGYGMKLFAKSVTEKRICTQHEEKRKVFVLGAVVANL